MLLFHVQNIILSIVLRILARVLAFTFEGSLSFPHIQHAFDLLIAGGGGQTDFGVAVFPPVLIIDYTEFDFVIDHAIFINASPMIFIVVDYYGARFVSFVIGCPESDFVID